jgi:hypothetical protein
MLQKVCHKYKDNITLFAAAVVHITVTTKCSMAHLLNISREV